MAKIWPPALTVSAGMMVRVSGTRISEPHALAAPGVDLDDAADPLDIGADDVHADAAAGNGGDLAGGRQAGGEDQRHLLLEREAVGAVGRDDAGADRLADQRVAVDAAAVVGHLDQDLVAGLARRDAQIAGLVLAGLGPALLVLDAMIDRVADDVGQRIADHLDHLAIELDVAAVDLELDRLAQLGGEIAHHPRQCREQAVDPLHAGARDRVADLADAGGDALERGLDGEVALIVAQPPGELVAGEHGVGDAAHHPVEQVDRQADAAHAALLGLGDRGRRLGLEREHRTFVAQGGDQLLVIFAAQRLAGIERLDQLADPVDDRKHGADQA